MLIQEKYICSNCSKQFIGFSPYNTFICRNCGKVLALCDDCKKRTTVCNNCGGMLRSQHEVSCESLGIDPNKLMY